jgi:hypothetical protein
VGNAEDARVVLLERLIDHAPLFPPASMSLADALDEDERARGSASAFALARFVCPASLLGDLPSMAHGVSAVLDAPFEHDPRVEAVEARAADDLDSIRGLAREVYVEVAVDDCLEQGLDRLADGGLRAKVRCGGGSPPSVAELARFVRGCRERGLVFKATAGLHHAVRTDGEHGFLNLLTAVVFGDEEGALAETDPGAFSLESTVFSWRGKTAGPKALRQARRERLHAIGSCSFFEPIAELEDLGVLPL